MTGWCNPSPKEFAAPACAGTAVFFHLHTPYIDLATVQEPPMAAIAELDAPETIEAELNYLVATGEKLVTQVAEAGGRDRRLSGDNSETHRVRIRNGRPLADSFEFEREGFRFVKSPSRVGNFYDEDEIRRVYYAECEALIKQVSGARRVVVFDHTLRTASEDQREAQKIRDIVSRVHND